MSWQWLEGYPSLDFANTVIRRGWTEHEAVTSVDDLESWLDAAALPAPRPTQVTQEDLEAFLTVRDAALRLLREATGHGTRHASDVRTLNEALLRTPEVKVLGDDAESTASQVVGPASPFTLLLARLAAEVRDVLAGARDDLALCDAPGCGQLFFRRRTNQAWCGPGCGNRARVARHHATTSQS
ncbi:CGNR zinc finger domain-containing protein [Kribbella sp. NPDC006257]|uniref:CGNR zinc finger domain-containing protein n=1 Tax=Kribbella sp. NPDC006257 TaxID=3156738 RepID=UPI0033B464EF